MSTTATNSEQSKEVVSWGKIRTTLKTEKGDEAFDSWLTSLQFKEIKKEPGKDGEDTVAYLTSPSTFMRNWVTDHYNDDLLSLWQKLMPEVTKVKIVVRTAILRVKSEEPQVTPVPQPQPAVFGTTASAPIRRVTETVVSMACPTDPTMNFSRFMVGHENEQAYGLLLGLSQKEKGLPAEFNPVCIVGPQEFGKTHLLQAYANAAYAAGKNVGYLTAERFMYRFAAAMKNNGTKKFHDALQEWDAFVLDDLQLLQGRIVQNELILTIKALISSGKQLVCASSVPLVDLDNITDATISHLKGGLVVEVAPFSAELRLKVIKRLALNLKEERPSADFSDEMLEYISGKTPGQGARTLKSILHGVYLEEWQSTRKCSIELVEKIIALNTNVNHERRVRVEDILRVVTKHYGVTRSDILSSRRTANVVRPRQIAMYLAKTLTLRSLPEIGRRFGGRDHTTVLHAVRKIEGLVGGDKALAEEIEVLKRMIND